MIKVGSLWDGQKPLSKLELSIGGRKTQIMRLTSQKFLWQCFSCSVLQKWENSQKLMWMNLPLRFETFPCIMRRLNSTQLCSLAAVYSCLESLAYIAGATLKTLPQYDLAAKIRGLWPQFVNLSGFYLLCGPDPNLWLSVCYVVLGSVSKCSCYRTVGLCFSAGPSLPPTAARAAAGQNQPPAEAATPMLLQPPTWWSNRLMSA